MFMSRLACSFIVSSSGTVFRNDPRITVPHPEESRIADFARQRQPMPVAGGLGREIPFGWDVPADAAHLPVPDRCEGGLFVQYPCDRPQLGLVQALGGGIGQVFLPW